MTTFRNKRSFHQPSRIDCVDRIAKYSGRNIPNWASQFMRSNAEHCVQEFGCTAAEENALQQHTSVIGTENLSGYTTDDLRLVW